MAISLNFVVKTALIWLVLGGFFCVFSQSETICNLHSCYKFCTRVTSLHSCYGRTALLSQPIRTEYFFSCILLTGISPLALTKSIYYYCCWCCCCYTALYPIKAVYTEKKKTTTTTTSHSSRGIFRNNESITSCPNHKLVPILPPKREHRHNIRQSRAYAMPRTHTNRFKNTFIPSMCT